MTRFARSSTSKASNKKVPEDATPWKDMASDQSNSDKTGQRHECPNETESLDTPKQFHSQPSHKGKSSNRYSNKNQFDTVKFDGSRVTKEEAERLKSLKRRLRNEGCPEDEVDMVIKKERRRAETHLKRTQMKVCFKCRQPGHKLSDCPEGLSDICYRCGSTEHTLKECKSKSTEMPFAKCFICGEQGHLSRACPDNARGLYPNGGCCKLCGAVTHFAKDCPTKPKREEEILVSRYTDNCSADYQPEPDDEYQASKENVATEKIVKFK